MYAICVVVTKTTNNNKKIYYFFIYLHINCDPNFFHFSALSKAKSSFLNSNNKKKATRGVLKLLIQINIYFFLVICFVHYTIRDIFCNNRKIRRKANDWGKNRKKSSNKKNNNVRIFVCKDIADELSRNKIDAVEHSVL